MRSDTVLRFGVDKGEYVCGYVATGLCLYGLLSEVGECLHIHAFASGYGKSELLAYGKVVKRKGAGVKHDADKVVDWFGTRVVGFALMAVGIDLADVNMMSAVSKLSEPSPFENDVIALFTVLDEVERLYIWSNDGAQRIAEVIEGVSGLRRLSEERTLHSRLALVGCGTGSEGGCASLNPHELPVEVERIIQFLAILEHGSVCRNGTAEDQEGYDEDDFLHKQMGLWSVGSRMICCFD